MSISSVTSTAMAGIQANMQTFDRAAETLSQGAGAEQMIQAAAAMKAAQAGAAANAAVIRAADESLGRLLDILV